MTWRNLGFQTHPWRAAVKAEGKTSMWGWAAQPDPTAVCLCWKAQASPGM